MAKPTRSDDWGFPRWRPYGSKGNAAAKVRLCDREGCNDVGDPAKAVIAFQRRFRPDRIDGIVDGECRAKLLALLLPRPQ